MYNRSGGPFFSVKSTVNVLADEGHQIIVFGTKDKNTQEKSPYTQEGKTNLIVKSLNKYGPYSLHYSPGISDYLKNFKDIDVASFQNLWLWNCAQAAKYCVKQGIPYMIAPRGAMNKVALNVSSLKKNFAKYWFANRFIRLATCFQALTSKEYQAIRDLGIKQPIAIIPNGISIPVGKIPNKNSLPILLQDKKIMLFLGRLNPIKNIENLIKGWVERKQGQNEKWHLVIAGSGNESYEKGLKELCKKLKIEDEVSFPGFITESEKPKWYGNADAFILPSHSEGMPMAALEAMSYKLPCIFSEACNIPEAYEANAAIKCETNSENIAQALTNLISKSEIQIQEMGTNALALVKQKYSWEIVSKQLIEVYQWMVDQSQPIPKCVNLK